MTKTSLADELGLSADQHQLVADLLRMGVTANQIRDAAERGRLEEAIFEGALGPEREKRTVSATEIEANGGLPVPDIQATLRAFGVAAPHAAQPYFTPAEAEVFRELGRLEEVWPRDVRLEVSRVYGQSLGRIAQTELHLFRSRVEPRLREKTPGPLDSLNAVRQTFGELLPLADPLLLGVHRRKLEQEMAQAAVWEVETEAQELMPATVEVSLLFFDLRHFTSYANRNGDAAAIAVLDRLASAVDENLNEKGRLVKGLGDGYLLAYPDPGSAVASALAIAAAMGPEKPSLHGGLHRGRAVFHEGDYYGRAVNLAARLLGRAKADELLATAAVARATPDLPWESRADEHLPGFTEPIENFALDLRAAPDDE